MAQKKPIVLNSGQFEQLQSGDYISSVDLPQLTNANAGSIVIGTPVYASANDSVDKAKADAVGTVNCIGLVADTSIAAAGVGGIQMDGILAATTGQWDAVAGTSGGLTKDVIYYLSAATAGLLTSTAPSTAGQYVKEIGIAISTTEMKIQVERRIKL
jgi:hypothetical protein